jgi:hypothetical protein
MQMTKAKTIFITSFAGRPLEASIREGADEVLKLAEERQPGSKEVGDARAALEAGDLDRAVELILKLAGSDAAEKRRI